MIGLTTQGLHREERIMTDNSGRSEAMRAKINEAETQFGGEIARLVQELRLLTAVNRDMQMSMAYSLTLLEDSSYSRTTLCALIVLAAGRIVDLEDLVQL